jgi:hypothetical protein
MRLWLLSWSAAKVGWLLSGERGKPRRGIALKKSLNVQERTKHRLFCSRASALSFVSIAHHVSKSDADKDALRKQLRHAGGKRALTLTLWLSPWSAAKVEVMVTFWRERKTRAEIAENIPPCTGNNQAQAVFHRANLFRRSCMSHADKVASREQLRPCRWITRFT